MDIKRNRSLGNENYVIEKYVNSIINPRLKMVEERSGKLENRTEKFNQHESYRNNERCFFSLLCFLI